MCTCPQPRGKNRSSTDGTVNHRGPQRTRQPIRPSRAARARWRLPCRQQAPGMLSRGTMAPVCRLRPPAPRWQTSPLIIMFEHLYQVPLDGSDALFGWLKRAQLLGATRFHRRPTKVGLRDRKVARGPALCASEWVRALWRPRRWSRSSGTLRSMSDIFTSGGRGAVARGLSRR